MNAGAVEWGGSIAKSVGAKGIAYGGTFSGALSRGALLLSALVHGGLAAAFIGWGEPQATPPQPIPIAIVAVAPADAGENATASGAPPIAQTPHSPAVPQSSAAEPAAVIPTRSPAPQPNAVETPAEPPLGTTIGEPGPGRAEPAPVLETARPDPVVEPSPEPAFETPPAPSAKPAEPPAEQIVAAEPVVEPAFAAPMAGQTAALPDPASALGAAPETLQTGSPSFAPARYDVAALANPEPDYPWASRRAGEEGRVVLQVEVSAAGTVEAIGIADSSGHRRLDKAALEAVRQWRFEPARMGDQAIATTVNVPVTFRLE